jgi:hypothetical protein
LRPLFDRCGLRGCGGHFGPHESLAFFAHAHDVPLGQLREELRAGLESPPVVPAEEITAPRPADAIYRRFFKAGIGIVLTLGADWGACRPGSPPARTFPQPIPRIPRRCAHEGDVDPDE